MGEVWLLRDVVVGRDIAMKSVKKSSELDVLGFLNERRLVVATLAIVGLVGNSRIAGAFIVVPELALGLSVGIALFPRAVATPFAVAAGWVAIGLPLVLERAGVLPVSYEFSADRLCIRAQQASFPEGPTLVYFALMSFVPIAVVCLYLGRVRERLAEAEQRIRIQAWQLRQIVPEE